MWQSIKNIYHLAGSVIANVLYLFPAKKFTVIAVSGTDGKTTTVSLIYHILKTAGCKVSMISSTGAVIKGKEYPLSFHVTTPSSFALQKFFKLSLDSKQKYMVLEVTSHALDQKRIFGIPIEIAVLTNITHEHLDYHKTYENYVYTKSKLLQMAKKVIVNMDDSSYNLISPLKGIKIKGEWITYGKSSKARFNPGNLSFKTNLIGDFNLYNCLAAAAACVNLGIDRQVIKNALKNFTLPVGREEIVYQKDFQVMIDFAHTPNSFEQILSSVRKNVEGKIIHVFGSAGRRDPVKRSKMGGISAKYADVIILTAEDPRGEDVNKIIDQIQQGIQIEKRGKVLKIANRQEAINQAIAMAEKNDLVILTGKGHERSMNLGFGEQDWSEHEAVKKALVLRYGKR